MASDSPVNGADGTNRAERVPVDGPITTRRFVLLREVDVTGVSGVGVVAEGIQFTDKSIALRWRGDWPMTAIWPSLMGIRAVHGHVGATQIRWLDSERGPGGRHAGRSHAESSGTAWERHDDPHPPPLAPDDPLDWAPDWASDDGQDQP